MPKGRRLTDLYTKGTEVVIDDGLGDPITLWLQKLNPLEHEKAMRAANAKRARTLALRKDPESDGYQAYLSQVYDLGDERDNLISYLISPEAARFAIARDEEFSHEEEWEKDGYLQSLRDIWNSEYEKRFLDGDADDDVLRVKSELDRFEKLVTDAIDAEIENLKRSYENVETDDLRDRVVEQMLKMQGDMDWLREFHHQEVFYATRFADNKKKYYFEDRDEVSEIPLNIYTQLSDAYHALIVEPLEGKGSAATGNSSQQSEPQEKPEEVSSGQEAASQ